MPLFGKRAIPQSEDERQAAAVDLERIQAGGIPLGAEERLKGIAAASSAVFSSDLSAKEYAVAQASGLTPVAQIMGSSVVQHGWQNYNWSSYGGGLSEIAWGTPSAGHAGCDGSCADGLANAASNPAARKRC